MDQPDQPPYLSPETVRLMNPDLQEAEQNCNDLLLQVEDVLVRGDQNPWVLDDAAWKWLNNLQRIRLDFFVELEKLQPEIEALREEAAREDEDPVPAAKVRGLYSIPCLPSCIKRKTDLKAKDRFILLYKELTEILESGFKYDDVVKFEELLDESHKPTTCELRVSEVRGQTFEKDRLLKYFFNSPGANDVIKDRTVGNLLISIRGQTGTGKTTLAQMVYNDKGVVEYYQVRKWVCVKNYFDDKIINIVRRELIGGDQYEEDAKRDDGDMVVNFLSGKTFLLVFDDVLGWGDDMMANFFCDWLLDNGAPGSIILFTNEDFINGVDNEHIVRPLSTSDCWSILKRKALLGKPQLLIKQVRNVGWKFAKECGGTPLGAKIVGDYLKSKATWDDAFGDEMWQTKIMSILSRLRYPDLFDEYSDLSDELKCCFSYCAVFPKDTQIDVERLVALWAAMDYIGEFTIEEDASMEKRGYDLVACLESNSMFAQVKRSIHKNKITSCMITEKYYVVAKHAFHDETMFRQMKNLGRSLVIFSHGNMPEDLFKGLRYVKALVLSSCKLEQLSDEVASLDLLEFLDLSGNPLKILPETVSDLKGLKSLYLHSCYLLSSLPRNIGDLEYLRHLRINHTTDKLHHVPQGFEKLTSITTLDVFRVGGIYDNNIGKLKELNSLVDIRIAVHGEVWFSEADLQNKSELENLELCFVGKGRDPKLAPFVEKLVPPLNLKMLLIEDYHGLVLPMWILADSFIKKLKRLSLRSAVNINSLPPMWELSSLEFLWIYDMPKITQLGIEFFGLPKIQQPPSSDLLFNEEQEYFSEDESVSKRDAFRRLKTLRIEYLESWEIWEDVDEHYEKKIKVMPVLEDLIISDCPKLHVRPLRILRDTPWYKKTHCDWEDSEEEIVVVDVGGKHDHSNIQKLKDLNLHAYELQIAIHGKVYFQDADLESNVYLKGLILCFIGDGLDPEKALCIEDLKPPLNLIALRIDDYPGLRLPNWILAHSVIHKLKNLTIRSASNISSFPSLWKLSCLEVLLLFDIQSLKCLGLEFFGCSKTGEDEGIDGDKTAFPCLETLRIECLHNWETWEDIDVVEACKKVMPSLEKLIISDCPKLQGLPLHILRDTPWSKKQYKPSTSKGKEIEAAAN